MLLSVDPEATFVGMAFKLVDDPYGQLTFMRIYQGGIQKGRQYTNQRTGRKQRFSRIVRMHADKREEIDNAFAGDIVAIMGIDAASGVGYFDGQSFEVTAPASDPDFVNLENKIHTSIYNVDTEKIIWKKLDPTVETDYEFTPYQATVWVSHHSCRSASECPAQSSGSL